VAGSPTSIAVNRTGRYVRVQLAGTNYLHMAEVQVLAPPTGTSDVEWLVSDQLGTPRMVFDKTGSLSGVKRHDYLPFGEELYAGTGGRTTAQGYSQFDGVRQKFTKKERDAETGLDFFEARYYSSLMGRFTSPDEFTGGPHEIYGFVDAASENPLFYADLADPQSLNKYQYSYNNPLRYVDPDGHEPDSTDPDPQGQGCPRCIPIPAGPTPPEVIDATKKLINHIIDKLSEPGTPTTGPTTGPADILTRPEPQMAPIPVPDAATAPVPPMQQTQPLPLPAPIQYHPPKKQSTGKNKDHPKETERPGAPNKRPPGYRPFRRPPPKPKPAPEPPRPKPEPKPEIGPDGNPVAPRYPPRP